MFTTGAFAETVTEEPLNYGWCGDNMTWYLDTENGLLTIEGSGEMYDYIYDFDFQHLAPWYDFRDIIQTVVISPGIAEVGQFAFWSCDKIRSVTIPDTVKSIEASAFYGCSALESITIPSSVTNIGDRAFGDCQSLRTVQIPSSVTTLGNNVFIYCTGLEEMVIPDTVSSIGFGMFSVCSSLRSVKLPDHMTAIGTNFFYGCRKLEQFNFPANVTSIGGIAFNGCESLTSMHIPEGVTTIGFGAFSGCSGLKEVSFPSTLTTMDEQIFAGCTGLTKIEIPATLKTIAPFMFYNCDGLLQIKFLGDAPDFPISSGNVRDTAFTGVQAIAYYPAGNPTWNAATKKDYGGKLTWMAYDPQTGAIYPEEPENWVTGFCGDNAQWKLELTTGALTVYGSGAIYDYQHYNVGTPAPWYAYAESIKSVNIGSGITSVGAYAFCGCKALTTLTMADTVTALGRDAFDFCSGLKTVELSSNLKSVGIAAFYYCTALEEIALPEGLTTIEGNAFVHCTSLADLTLPSTLTTLGMGVFQSCTSLTSITIPQSLTSLPAYTFNQCSSLKEIHFSSDAPTFGYRENPNPNWEPDTVFLGVTATAYYPLGNTTWTEDKMRNYGGTITWQNYIPGLDPEVAPTASGWCGDDVQWDFYESSGHLLIHGTGDMYNYCNTYEYTELPPWYDHAQNIKTVVIQWGVTSVGDYAFESHQSLSQVILPYTLISIGKYAFQSTTALETIHIPNTVTTIGDWAFFRGGLTCVEVPNSVTNMGQAVFYFCHELASATLPKGMTTLPSQTFVGCKKLTGFTFPKGLTTIGISAFRDCTGLVCLTVPEGVTTIEQTAFSGCTALSQITLPESLTLMEQRVFTGCTSLKEITIPSGITKIYSYTFSGCTGLKEVRFAGDAPTYIKQMDGFLDTVFANVTATVYFPSQNQTWTLDYLRQDFGGKLSWFAYTPESPGFLSQGSEQTFYFVGNDLGCGAGLIYKDGHYYYIRSGGYAATGFYWVSKTNGLLPEGLYEFDSDGKMILGKHGIVEENGKLYYYLGNNLQYAAGLIAWEDCFYYVRSNGQVVTGQYWVTNTNGRLAEGIYTFRSDGSLVIKTEGIVEIDGLLYYFVDGEIQYGAGAILIGDNCYYIRSNGTCAIGTYYVTNTNDLLEEGFYTFGDDGVLIWY